MGIRTIFLVMSLGFVVTFGILILGMTLSTDHDPYAKILDADEIPGEWELVEQENRLVNWDRQGGYREAIRTYTWSDADLMIQVTEYYLEERADRLFPAHGPSDESEIMTIQVGDEGIYWTEEDVQHIHFRQGGFLIYSSLQDGGNPELDFDWFMDVMETQDLIVGGR
jgi:hypothetical protein